MTRRGEELNEQLLEFAARIAKVVDALPNTRLGRHVAGQLVQSATSPAPNYAEACRPMKLDESKLDERSSFDFGIDHNFGSAIQA